MKILVTGATGFVGGHLTQELVRQGHEVCILRRSQSDVSDLAHLDIKYCLGDVTDSHSLIQASRGVDVVCHLAGVVGYSKAMRTLMEQVNVLGTQHVINACLKNNVKRLLYMSSVVSIGASFNKEPLNENSQYNLSRFNLGYFETKRRAEQKVQEAVKKHQLDAVILNPSTIYGPGDAKKGSRGVQLKVAKGRFPFYTSGGVSVVAVEDVIEAISSAIEKGRTGERYIISGDNILIKDLFRIIAEEAQSRKPYIYLPNPLVRVIGLWGDGLERVGRRGPLNSENAKVSIMYHWFDSMKAQRELGLRPKPAREAIASSVRWMMKEQLI